MDWIQPAAFIAGAVAIVGWFVASWLRLYETQRENRRSTYTKVLSPAANCIAQLRHACDSNRGAWSATQHAAFEKCYIELVAAEGEVELIGKSKVAWSAAYLRKLFRMCATFRTTGHHPVKKTQPASRNRFETSTS